MNGRIKFTVGSERRGYKSVELFVDGTRVTYKILRNEFNPVDKNPVVVNVDETWSDALKSVGFFIWEKFYRGEKLSGEQWSLTFTAGDEIYQSRGTNAYPDTWEDFLDCLDALIPDMNFIDGRRVDAVDLLLPDVERLSLSRRDKTLIIEKGFSTHTYRLDAENTKNFLDICQKYFDALEVTDDKSDGTKIFVKLRRHDKTTTEFDAAYSEFVMPNVVRFSEKIQAFAPDLAAKIFDPENMRLIRDTDRIILCKVQFKGTYKTYTYRAEDETLAVGDVVDVPVGRNNDVTQAKIVEIGYFDEDEAPFPLEKIKTIIGRHTGNAWDNY